MWQDRQNDLQMIYKIICTIKQARSLLLETLTWIVDQKLKSKW